MLGSTGLIKVRLGRLEWRLLPQLPFVLEFIFNLNMHVFKTDANEAMMERPHLQTSITVADLVL